MKKYIYTLLLLAISVPVLFSSCKDNDDDEQNEAVEKWKAYNEGLVDKVKASAEYREQESMTKGGKVYWKETNDIKISATGQPHFTDSVVIRFSAWFFDYDGKKIEYDGTEGEFNQPQGRGFRISNRVEATSSTDRTKAMLQVTDGLATMLQHMTLNKEREFCVPQALGYSNSSKYLIGGTVPAYTTLWYKVKLIKIIPLNPNEF